MEREFLDVKSKIEGLINSESSFSNENINSLNELAVRINELEKQYASLMKLNENYIQDDPFGMEINFDPKTGTIITKTKGGLTTTLKLNRANPTIPVQMASKSSISAFIPKPQPANKDSSLLESQRGKISSELEGLYFNASKIWDLIEKTLLGKNSSKFIGVKMVRNLLIEHNEKGDIFSFGVSEESGPTVKPLRLASKTEERHDAGLLKNTKELLQKTSQRLDTLRQSFLP